jgi:hypothetical protein
MVCGVWCVLLLLSHWLPDAAAPVRGVVERHWDGATGMCSSGQDWAAEAGVAGTEQQPGRGSSKSKAEK